jgi:drug/metabolite transporter (DMT)-like permease
MDRLFRLERGNGDGRHRAGVAGSVAAALHHLALAAFFNGETITPQIVLFAAAVVATVAISTRSRGRKAPSAQTSA